MFLLFGFSFLKKFRYGGALSKSHRRPDPMSNHNKDEDMKTIPSIMLLILATAPLANCAPKGSKGSPGNQTPATAVGTGTGSGNANAAGTTGAAVPAPATATTAAITADYWPSGYWLGFDGKTTFTFGPRAKRSILAPISSFSRVAMLSAPTLRLTSSRP